MSSIKPYLIRAVYEWAVNAGLTPHIVVDATTEGVEVPPGYVDNGRIVLNIHPQALRDLEIGEEWVLFSARFSRKPFAIEVPVPAVLAVFAAENGQGISFPQGASADDGVEDMEALEDNVGSRRKVPKRAKKSSKKGPTLHIVK